MQCSSNLLFDLKPWSESAGRLARADELNDINCSDHAMPGPSYPWCLITDGVYYGDVKGLRCN